MKYDFTTLQKRIGIGSHKWDAMKRLNPQVSDDAVPFTTADMEFLNAPEIREAIASYASNNILGYTAATDEYYNSLKKWMKKHHDLECFQSDHPFLKVSVLHVLAFCSHYIRCRFSVLSASGLLSAYRSEYLPVILYINWWKGADFPSFHLLNIE